MNSLLSDNFLEKTLYTIPGLLLAAFTLLLITLILFHPTSAIEINPSVENQPLFCKYSLTSFLCDRNTQAHEGPAGPAGLNGTDNFSAVYFSPSNFTAHQNLSYFINSTNFTSYSNYTVIQGSTYYNGSINDSYAYLPGRPGGQVLTGGTSSSDSLTLNGSQNNGIVVLQPRNGGVHIGAGSTFTPTTEDFSIRNYITVPKANPNNLVGMAYSDTDTASLGINYWGYSLGATRFRDFYVANGKNTVVFFVDGSALSVGIGTTAPTTKFHVAGNARISGLGAGTVTADAGGNLTSVSDEKYKTNVQPLDTKGSALDKVKLLIPKSFRYTVASGLDSTNTYVGFVAQDVEKVIPEAVKTKTDVRYDTIKSKDKNGEDIETTIEIPLGTTTKSLDDRAIIAVLVNALKEEDAKVTAQQKQIDELKSQLDKAKL